MNRRFLLLFAICIAVAGCRQSDGNVPAPQGEQVNKADDISRDLQGIAAAEQGAATDLRDDLANLSGEPPPDHLVSELANSLNQALAGTTLSDAAAKGIADKLFVATTARDLSERQQAMLRTEVSTALTSAGVPAAKAEPVSNVVGEIQAAIGENRKRWWHWR
jgi:hypothetical protein